MREYLIPKEVKAFLAVGRRMRNTLIKKVMVQTGMRVGECCCMQIKDLELDRERIRLSKAVIQATGVTNPELYKQDRKLTILVDGKKKSMLPAEIVKMKGDQVKCGLKANHPGRYVEMVNPETIEQLRAFTEGRDPDEWMWTAQGYDRRLSKKAMQTMISEHLAKAGVRPENCHAHILRHTFAVHGLKVGRSLAMIQRALGHTNIKTTTIYLSLVPDDVIEDAKKHPLPF
jgi:site-specific recombinase XerD